MSFIRNDDKMSKYMYKDKNILHHPHTEASHLDTI